jgi:Zn-dependent M28 family amino/carboxypeptidase
VAERIRKDNLLAHLRRLVGDRNAITRPRQLRAAAVYITEQFRQFGYATRHDDVRFLWRKFPNIIAGDGDFIIGAHYDSVAGSPGADDNASGVAALLELARVCLDVPRLRLIAFTLEEENMLGSSHYAKKLAAPIAGMVSLEMLGFKSDAPESQQLPAGLEHLYPHTGNFIGVVGNERSRQLLEKFVATMKVVEGLPVESLVVPGNGESVPPTRLSDHSPFWDCGHPALMITDTSWFRNPHYHQPSDTIETLDLDFLARVSEGVARAVISL